MLSVVITAWNEEKNLPRVVQSVASFADEVIVVDTQSTDKTVEIAKSLKCKVFHHQNTSVVEPVRNFSISKAKGDWILLLDADEEVSSSLASQLLEIVKSDSADYVRIPRKNIIFGQWIKTSHWWPDYVYRFFKKGHVEWDEKIHSIPLTQGRGLDLPKEEKFSIIHHHYDSISQFINRLNRYTDVQSEELISSNYKFTWQDLLVKPSNEFLTQYFSRKGYTHGLHGLALSMLQAFSTLVLYLKLWQSSGFAEDHDVTPDNLKKILNPEVENIKWWYFQQKIDDSPGPIKFIWKLARKVNKYLE